MRTANMEIEVENAAKAVVVRLGGSIVIESSPSVRAALQRLVRDKAKAIVLSLGGAERVDTSALATFIECARAVGQYGGKLLVVGLNEQATDTFSLAQVDGAFLTFETEADALASLG